MSKSKKGKKKSSSTKTDEEFEVDVLLNKRIKRKNKEYLVQWKGYSWLDATWELSEDIPQHFIDTYENSAKDKKDQKSDSKEEKTEEKKLLRITKSGRSWMQMIPYMR